MDDVVADPAGQMLWGGNDKGLWKMVPLSTVVTGIVTGIERRAELIVVPKTLTLTAKAPGAFRPIIERLGFRGSTIARAIELASSSGWHDSQALHRHDSGSATTEGIRRMSAASREANRLPPWGRVTYGAQSLIVTVCKPSAQPGWDGLSARMFVLRKLTGAMASQHVAT
jgi:hypothetical protein